MSKEENKLVIDKDMTIGEVVMLKPQTITTLMGIGMACIGCPASLNETVEEAAYVHGIETDSLVEALNK